MSDSRVGADAASLAAFFTEVAPRLLVDVQAAGVLAGADLGRAEREWHAAALYASIRGAVAEGERSAALDALVDDFHERVLPTLAPAAGLPALRAHLAARYGEYDGIARTLGRQGAEQVPVAIAAACAGHVAPADRRALADTLAPLLESLAEGAAAALARAEAAEGDLVLPPLAPLLVLTARMDQEGIPWGLGASALLASLGLVREVHDWDVQVDAEPERLQWLYAQVAHTFHGHGGCHADWKLAFADAHTELIPRFAFYAPAGIVRIPLHVSGRWRGLPVASPEGWACAYWLMGEYDSPALRPRRSERAELLLGHLTQHGASATRIEELLAEPLPEPLAARLRALPAGA